MEYNDIMIDIETLDTKPSAVILSIGAVKFNKEGLGEKIYLNLEVESQLKTGRTVSASTIQWWLKQSDAARSALDLTGGYASKTILRSLELFFDRGTYRVWGNGATFDNVIVADYLDSNEAPRLWKYNKDRCYRTLKAQVDADKLNVIEWRVPATAHNALDDAVAQAHNAITALTLLNAWES